MTKVLIAMFTLVAFIILLGKVWAEIDKMHHTDLDKDQ
jgi:hypothetical protein